jgi:hypothetical protein
MIVFWRGAGPLVLLYGIIAAVVMNVVSTFVFRQNDYFATHSWTQALALWAAGAASWFTGKYLNGRPGKELIEKQTGKTIILRPIHDLMFIKMQYWGLIYFAIGVGVLILGFVGP